MVDSLEKQAEPSRDARGRLLPGHTANLKGRPKGIDLRALAEREAFIEGIDIEDALWRVLKSMIEKAKAGDVKAAQLVFERLSMPESKDPTVNLQLSQVQATASGGEPGPPLPLGGEFADWVRDLNRVAAQQGLLGDATPTEVEAEALADAEEDDEEDDLDGDKCP